MEATAPFIHPTAATFEEQVLKSDLPVLIDFWAPWCPPCRALKPELARLATDFAATLRVATINVDENPELAEQFNVQGIPALFVVKGGKVVDAWAGYMPKEQILMRLNPHLKR